MATPATKKHTVQVDNGQVRARGHQGLTHDQTKTTSTTRHDADLVLQRKRGKRALEVQPTTALHDRTTRHFMVLGIFNDDILVGTGEGALVVSGFPSRRVRGGGTEFGIVLHIVEADGRGRQRARVDPQRRPTSPSNGSWTRDLADGPEGLASSRRLEDGGHGNEKQRGRN